MSLSGSRLVVLSPPPHPLPRRYNDHYWLTPADAFAYDHLPERPADQLLDPPITAANYAELAYLRPAFFRCGLRARGPPGRALFSRARAP